MLLILFAFISGVIITYSLLKGILIPVFIIVSFWIGIIFGRVTIK